MFEEGEVDINLPLPIMVSDQEVSGQHNRGGLSYTPELAYSYRVRFTPVDTEGNWEVYDAQEVLEEFLNDKFDIWILGVENKPYTHFHMYIESELKIDDLKKKVREFLYPLYPERKRGFGNKQYSVLPSDKPLETIMYALKQRGEYHFSGFEDDFVAKCIASSFDKPVKQFEVDMATLNEEFMSKDMDPYIYTEELALVYSRHGKRINWKALQEIGTSMILRKDPSRVKNFVKNNINYN